MATLFDALEATARSLSALRTGVVTAGSGATFTDTELPLLGVALDDYTSGTALILQDTTGSPPQGESRLITACTAAGMITVSPSFSASAGVGDVYGLISKRYTREIMVSKINEALLVIGRVPTEDTSASSSGVTEYSYSTAICQDIRAVYVAQNATSPYDWELNARVMVDKAGAFIKFASAPPTGNLIRIVYMAPPARVEADTDTISAYISMDWLALRAASECARHRLAQSGVDTPAFTQQINDLMQREERARRRAVTTMPCTPVFP
jgi:hypothetical protein